MNCYFCKSSKHLSENCNIYPTLQSRYSLLKFCQKYCLCENYDPNGIKDCKCNTFCDACFQQHHIAFCPRKDPSHPLFVKITDKDVIKLDMPMWNRFFVLCSPLNKIRLQLTCKWLYKLQDLNYHLSNLYNYTVVKPNIIYNGYGCITWKTNLKKLEEEKNIFFNLQSIGIYGGVIKKDDLTILSKSDAISIRLFQCKFHEDLSFYDFLNAFPYCIDYSFNTKLPSNWIGELILAKRNVEIKSIFFNCSLFEIDLDNDVYLEYLVKLFQANGDLKFTFFVGKREGEFGISFQRWEKNGFIRFSDKENYNLAFKSYLWGSEIYFDYFYFDAFNNDFLFKEKQLSLQRLALRKLSPTPDHSAEFSCLKNIVDNYF